MVASIHTERPRPSPQAQDAQTAQRRGRSAKAMWPALAELAGVAGSPWRNAAPEESPLKRDPRRRPLEERVEGDRAHRPQGALAAKWHGGVRKIALSVLGTRRRGAARAAAACKALQVHPIPAPGEPKRRLQAHWTPPRKREGARKRCGCFPRPSSLRLRGPEHSTLRWLHAAAQAADFRARG